MSIEEIEKIKKKYLSIFNSNEQKFSSKLTPSEYLALEIEQMKIDALLEELDDLLDALKDDDALWAKFLEEGIREKIK